jgi:hypothetical protein
MSTARVLRLAALVLGLAVPAFAAPAPAEAPAAPETQTAPARIPALPAAPPLDEFTGRPLSALDVNVEGGRIPAPALQQVRVGQVFSPEVARLAIQELLDTGRFADVRA